MKDIPPVASSYNTHQLLEYLSFIGFDKAIAVRDAIPSASETLPFPTLDNLQLINHLHRLSFNYETSQMHYTEEHLMDVTPDAVFRRLVSERKGGSYCFGLNILLLEVLRGLRYHVYSGAAQHAVQKYIIASTVDTVHMILFVQIPGDTTLPRVTYLVDVGFGGTGLIRLIILDEDSDNIVQGTTPSEVHRVKRIDAPVGRDPTDSWWCLDYAHVDDSQSIGTLSGKPSSHSLQWNSIIVFSEKEYLLEDYIHASYLMNTMPDGARLWWEIVGVKYFLVHPITHLEVSRSDPEYFKIPHDQAWYGRYTLSGNLVKRSIGGNSEILKTLTTERERISVLREFFDVVMDDEDERYIKGRAAAYGSGYVPVFYQPPSDSGSAHP
jgi:arylamine N-acetyltransferase